MTNQSKSNNSLPSLCGVIGNPVEHSLSPQIHSSFTEKCNISLDYQKYLVESEELNAFVTGFFAKGGTGLNVTLPFKQQVIPIVDKLTNAAKVCQSVNTLYTNNGKLVGDTTDGKGLILDLERLNFETNNKNILVVGAGGASLSVIYSLLENESKVYLHNRSQEKIPEIIKQFSNVGEIHPFKPKQEILFDGVICSVSKFNQSFFDQISPKLKPDAFVYDLNYGKRAEESLNYFRTKNIERLSDGYGMLVGQAAKAFEIWFGVLPDIKV